MRSLSVVLLVSLAGCRPSSTTTDIAEPEQTEASGAVARWSYEIEVDADLERMQIGLCIDGPRPRRLIAGDGALEFVRAAKVRGGPALAHDHDALVIETLGDHGCVDLEIDLERAANTRGRDADRVGESLLLAPDRWLWYPAAVPDQVEARARFELPEGIAATVPWPEIDTDDPDEWRSLDPTSFGWNAWIAIGHYQPLRFVAAGCEFEIAVLDAPHQASDAGIEAWIRAAAETSAQLYGRFPRDRVAVVVVPSRGWGAAPVMFGMARRGGGGSVMLLLDDSAGDAELPGEWVAVHELLHLGMPLVAEPWMSEGFVTYYTHVLRARAGLLPIQTAVEILASGFEDRPSNRSLASASANMRRDGSYRRVYWGGAALAFDLDVSIRRASHNRRSLDDLMLELWPLAPAHQRFPAHDLLGRMDEVTAAWFAADELDHEISCAAIAARHLEANQTPIEIQELRGIAVADDSGQLRLLADPIDQVEIRAGLFAPKLTGSSGPN